MNPLRHHKVQFLFPVVIEHRTSLKDEKLGAIKIYKPSKVPPTENLPKEKIIKIRIILF